MYIYIYIYIQTHTRQLPVDAVAAAAAVDECPGREHVALQDATSSWRGGGGSSGGWCGRCARGAGWLGTSCGWGRASCESLPPRFWVRAKRIDSSCNSWGGGESYSTHNRQTRTHTHAHAHTHTHTHTHKHTHMHTRKHIYFSICNTIWRRAVMHECRALALILWWCF